MNIALHYGRYRTTYHTYNSAPRATSPVMMLCDMVNNSLDNIFSFENYGHACLLAAVTCFNPTTMQPTPNKTSTGNLVAFTSLLSLSAIALVIGSNFRLKSNIDRQFQECFDQVQELKSFTYVPQRHRVLQDANDVTNESTCQCDSLGGYTLASNYGLVGDGDHDDGPALQAAIDAASSSISGGTVLIPHGTFRINQPLIVTGGVTLQGMGYGSSPLAIQFDAGASTIAYCGTDYAVKVTGSSSSLRNLAVYDWNYGVCENIRSAGGILVEADQTLVESVTISNVLIYFFVEGSGLSLIGMNAGGIAYGSFDNLRIRHARNGISLSADSTSFVK